MNVPDPQETTDWTAHLPQMGIVNGYQHAIEDAFEVYVNNVIDGNPNALEAFRKAVILSGTCYNFATQVLKGLA